MLRHPHMRTTIPFLLLSALVSAQQPVSVQVDASTQLVHTSRSRLFRLRRAELYLHDERQEADSRASRSQPAPVYIRTHFMLATGDGTPGLKWGSTNAYTEDANGKPVYDWTIVDRILEHLPSCRREAVCRNRIHAAGSFQSSGALSSDWIPGDEKRAIQHWLDLSAEGLRKVGRTGPSSGCSMQSKSTGRAEVASWYWEVWNEPNIGYWHGTPEEYDKLYDYAADCGEACAASREE